MVTIIAVTLKAVAAIDNLIINLENDFCLFNAILRAIVKEKFKIYLFAAIKSTCKHPMQQTMCRN
jgi:hypothetical protein